MTINERFDKIIRELYSGNKRAFANAIGVAPTVIENVVGSRQGKPSFDVIAKVCALTNINTEWVVSGEGEMLGPINQKNVAGANIVGDGNFSATNNNDLLDIIKKKDEQIDRLITLLEKNSNSKFI